MPLCGSPLNSPVSFVELFRARACVELVKGIV